MQSPKTFEVLGSISLQGDDGADENHAHPDGFQFLKGPVPKAKQKPAKTVYVLDSSFNPPTLAHLHIATSALCAQPSAGPARLLLLLALQNADKQAAPASLEHRLVMMYLMAHEVKPALIRMLDQGNAGVTKIENLVSAVDIGVTKLPFFVDKAEAIASSNGTFTSKPNLEDEQKKHEAIASRFMLGIYTEETEQVHLTGYDTLIRIFEPKYYFPDYRLEKLDDFFRRYHLRVTLRPDDKWGSLEDQKEFLDSLARGHMDELGAKQEWASRIDMVVEKTIATERGPVSSSYIREAAAKGNEEELDKFTTPDIAAWVLENRLYGEEDRD